MTPAISMLSGQLHGGTPTGLQLLELAGLVLQFGLDGPNLCGGHGVLVVLLLLQRRFRRSMEHDRISRQQRRAIGFGPARLGPPPSSTFEVHSTAHVENIAADNNINDDSGTATKHDSKMHPPDKGKGKRVAPISSGAFSFSLGAGPSKKPKGDEGNNNKAAASEHVGASKPRSPVVSKTLRQPSKTHAQTAVTTPRRPERPLNSSTAKPSPRLQAMPPPMSLTLTPKLQKTDVTQTTPTSARRAPPTFSLAEASPKGLGSPQIARTRPLNPVSGSPFRLSGITAQKAPKPDGKPLQGLTSLSQMQVSQSLPPPHPSHTAETAGVVSPRKRKSARKSG